MKATDSAAFFKKFREDFLPLQPQQRPMFFFVALLFFFFCLLQLVCREYRNINLLKLLLFPWFFLTTM